MLRRLLKTCLTMTNVMVNTVQRIFLGAVGAFLVLYSIVSNALDTLAEKWYRFGKWILRHTTRLCQLQRIIYGELPGYRRTKFVEDSLRRSQTDVVKNALTNLGRKVERGGFNVRNLRRSDVNGEAFAIAKIKGINTKLHTGFVPNLAVCLEMMFSYQDLCTRIIEIRSNRYDSDDRNHETKLLQIWENLMAPETLTGRKSRQWQYLGFQGNDPATDFRASGELGLNFILYFTRAYQERARQVLGVSNHPSYSFPLAILMIQVIDTCHQLFISGEAKTHFYNRHAAVLSIDEEKVGFTRRPDGLVDIFFDFGCVLLVEFSRFWIGKKPRNIMAFPPIYKEFVKEISEKLKDDNCVFLMDIQNI